MKRTIFCNIPLIEIRLYTNYSNVSMSIDSRRSPLTEKAIDCMGEYLNKLRPYMKRSSPYSWGNGYSHVTVKKELSYRVAQKFLDIYRQSQKEIAEGLLVDYQGV